MLNYQRLNRAPTCMAPKEPQALRLMCFKCFLCAYLPSCFGGAKSLRRAQIYNLARNIEVPWRWFILETGLAQELRELCETALKDTQINIFMIGWFMNPPSMNVIGEIGEYIPNIFPRLVVYIPKLERE